ncbi:hypothetical protein [Pseudoalteromonas luteoviolacea]|uniref:hypothetical protein n=1 Tax=Pseudoalteromonas luteoviolacea TaxID=43657 RepID=UPI001B3773BD|nr:hypothetical protein [Pseudoalteromonas luteoviolacea]MBQ4838491.1 hypothetical protein [Pseudoalteromonas luteoviolacea]
MNCFYKRLETSLAGMDGGNINAKLWFSGLEWAGKDEAITLEVTRPTYSENTLSVPYLSPDWKRKNPNFYKWQFDQKIAKIICRVLDYKGAYKEYMQDHYCNSNSNEFKLNLFPLPCNDLQSWDKEHIAITNTKIKYHYQTHCSNNRFKLFASLVKQYKPSVIVCFGTRFLEEYKMAFWGNGEPEMLSDERFKLSKGKNEIYIFKARRLPTLIICPFLGRNLVANIELEELGDIIKSIL